jgi:hypothetical protein
VAYNSIILVSVSPTSLVFTATDWNVPRVLIVRPIDDTVYIGTNVCLHCSAT